MNAPAERAMEGDESETTYSNRNMLDRIGRRRLYVIVWYAMPFPWRLIAFPYGVVVYRRLLAASDTLCYLRAMHTREFHSSRLFRLLRPRYHKVERLLREYGFGDDRPTGQVDA
jgi:hypothetical protein